MVKHTTTQILRDVGIVVVVAAIVLLGFAVYEDVARSVPGNAAAANSQVALPVIWGMVSLTIGSCLLIAGAPEDSERGRFTP